MSISTHSKLRRLVVGSLVAVAAAAPLALGTAPAQAATSSGCTVTPLKPVFAGFNSSGVKLVRDKVSIRCSGDRSVTVDQRRYDTAPNPDKYLGHTVFKRTFHASASTTVWTLQALPETGPGNEHLYQRVRFQVTSHGVTSPWTSWQSSPSLSIPN